MSDDSDNYEVSDEEIDARKHDKLVSEVLNLNKIQNVKKPSRTEPTVNISEFNLVKSVTGDKGSIHLNALTQALKGRKKHEIISEKLQSTSNKSKTLPTPLEKPQADRIRRSLNYEKSRLKFDRWEALVTANRVAPHVTFPLNSTEKLKIEQKKSETYPSTWRIKSKLQTELEKLQPAVEEYHIEQQEKDEFPLTLNELKERRKESAKLRVHQSYKEAKARQQNKIKSKKYHRIMKRERIKEQLKEFEELQKTNPEEALRKLDDIEKARAEERFSLKHRGTGQWARNKQIRAKYDKESRQVLAQQLAISRELTQKLKTVESDSEDEGVNSEEKTKVSKENADNPWVSDVKPSKEVADFVSGYRKYWNDKNKTENPQKNKSDLTDNETEQDLVEKKTELEENKKETEVMENNKKKRNIRKKKEVQKTVSTKIAKGVKKSKLKKKTKSNEKEPDSTSKWKITDDVEDAFNKLEEKFKRKLKAKLNKLKNAKDIKKKKTSTKKKAKTKKIDLSLPSRIKKPVLDEEMTEKPGANNIDEENTIDDNPNSEINRLKTILDTAVQEKTSNIDPEKFLQVKTTNLNTAIPDILTVDETEENDSQREIILEAFEDDDIAADFRKEKENEVKKDTPGNIDLNLPGWGSWGGADLQARKRRKRFIIKMPPKMPRKDDNKGSLIINEKAQSKIKPHMVSELPFPFKSVKDYEASMRAPIGRTFVPETSFRKLIQPAVITKMGAIIEPITKSVLVGEKKM